ncbi:hypothetical protein ABH941_004657 [Streptacidiphilus sp. EB103A]
MSSPATPDTPPSECAKTQAAQAKPSPQRAVGAPQQPAWIKHGAVVLDAATRQLGEVQHIGPPYATGPSTRKDHDKVWLRPCGGGREWEATVADLSLAETGLQGAA